MIQIIKKEYTDLNEVIDDINVISIQYDYFKDYNIIEKNESYIALLKFDVPNKYKTLTTLDIAKIKKEKSSSVLDFKYKIELNDKDAENSSWSKFLECDVCNRMIRIRADFGIKDIIDLVHMTYIDNGCIEKEYIEVELNAFGSSRGFFTISSEVVNRIVCENVDYEILYNHIISVYLQRGLLLDRDGLGEFKDILKRVCKLINDRNITKKL